MIEKTDFGDPFGGPSMLQCNCADMCDNHPNCVCNGNTNFTNPHVNLHLPVTKNQHTSMA
jgi:hypothetical protein